MAWDAYTRKQFATALPQGEFDESKFYGLYNGLFNMFLKREDFMVVPQFKRSEYSKAAVHFTTVFIVRHNEYPVFSWRLNPLDISYSAREAADLQMREWFRILFDDVEISILYGVSAIGTRLCIYTWNKESRRITPNAIPIDCQQRSAFLLLLEFLRSSW
ncbi:hypothetical protein EV426DRAFT_100488 [Tirmania nivea]|nr:hypothetical protein EV426DRAFT_100488 [Tirmania nivea]